MYILTAHVIIMKGVVQVIGTALLLLVIQELRFLLPVFPPSPDGLVTAGAWAPQCSRRTRKDRKGDTFQAQKCHISLVLTFIWGDLSTMRTLARETWHYSWAAVAVLLVKDRMEFDGHVSTPITLKDCVLDKDNLSLSVFKETYKDRSTES